MLLEKRFTAKTAADSDEELLFDELDDYGCEFFCTMNPENVMPEDYAGLFDDGSTRDED